MHTCDACFFCVEDSRRVTENPYTGKLEILIDCWKRFTWHDAETPCEHYAEEV